MLHQWTTRNPPHGVLYPTMNWITELVNSSMPTALVSLLMDLPTPTLQTQKDSAWVCWLTSTEIQPLKAQDDTLGKVYICIMLEGRFMLNALATQPYLCRAEIVTTVMVFTQQQFARFHLDVHLKFSTTKNLLSCYLSRSTMILRLCLSWSRCAPFV